MTTNQGGAAPPPQQQKPDDRIDQLAARQERTESKIDKVLDMLGGKDDPPAPGTGAAGAGSPPADHLGEIKQAIRDVRAEEQQAAADAAHKADHDRLKNKPEPEKQPRESGPTWKDRLQNVMFGGDPT